MPNDSDLRPPPSWLNPVVQTFLSTVLGGFVFAVGNGLKTAYDSHIQDQQANQVRDEKIERNASDIAELHRKLDELQSTVDKLAE